MRRSGRHREGPDSWTLGMFASAHTLNQHRPRWFFVARLRLGLCILIAVYLGRVLLEQVWTARMPSVAELPVSLSSPPAGPCRRPSASTCCVSFLRAPPPRRASRPSKR